MAANWSKEKGEVADLMNRVPKIVFSRSLARADWKNTRLAREDAAAEMVRLKRESGLDFYIFGSAHLISSLLPAGLIDEIRLGLVPMTLSAGNPLFKAGQRRSDWKLLEAWPLKSGCVI
jgi:dihydrofolate reductase